MGVGTMTVCRICQLSGPSVPSAAEGGFGGNSRRIEFPPTDHDDRESVEPLLLTTSEVAGLLGIGRTKVFEMLASGDLPAIRIGRCVRISRDQLESWIDTRLEAAGLTRRSPGAGRRRPSGRS
jgi:excisionase family DNA binding protein